MDRIKKKREPLPRGLLLFFRVFLIVLIIATVSTVLTRVYSIRVEKERQQALMKSVEDARGKIEKIQYEIDEPLTKDKIIRLAREKCNMCFPDETIYYYGINFNAKE